MSLRGTGVDLKGQADQAALAGAAGLRILVHDFAGHPFQVDLSRAMARRGHRVLHVHCASYTSGKGRFDIADDDAELSVVGIPVGTEFKRYSPLRRVSQEIAYGKRFITVAREFRPDVVLASNVPLFAQTTIARWCQQQDVPWVFWLQDLYSVAAGNEAVNRAGPLGAVMARGFETLERSLLQKARRIVPITEDFAPRLDEWGVNPDRTTVIENWAPLDDIPTWARDNPWRREQNLGDRFVYLYSGTLGLKHRPELLYELASQHVGDADVMVISEGLGEARLREMLTERPLPNLRLLPFQPFDRYPEILGAADVLVALLEPTAGSFSVPSKVLSYLCAGRPILGAIPTENLAARTIERAGAGRVVAPTDEEGFLLLAKRLRNEPRLRVEAGERARAYAEATFDTSQVTDRFLAVIDDALGRPRVLSLR